jgi:hypothetical protein
MHKKNTVQNLGKASTNYHHLAMMWGSVLGKSVTPAQVVLCVHQLHFHLLIDHPHCRDTTVKMAETIFAYEAFTEASEDRQ